MDAASHYLRVNQANWDARALVHEAGRYGMDRLLSSPDALSDVVAFDRPRLGDLTGADGVHLQCHFGTDTLSLSRLGASMTGVDLSAQSLRVARQLAASAGAAIDYVHTDVYSAPEALGGRTFDLVYTGIGALCWLPEIRRWADVVARLLRPGGRLFVRDGHPAVNALMPVRVAEADPAFAEHAAELAGPGDWSIALELPYYEQPEALVWHDDVTYGGEGVVTSPENHAWNHGLGEIVTAVLDAGLRLTGLVEHDSLPWNPFGDLMSLDAATGEYRLVTRPERLPASFTLTAVKPA